MLARLPFIICASLISFFAGTSIPAWANSSKSCADLYRTGSDDFSANIKTMSLKERRKTLVTWRSSLFSDPRNHDPNKYRYIIRGIGNAKPDYVRDCIEQIASRPNRSASIIDETNTRSAFSFNVGLILSIPPQNIVGTSTNDMARFWDKNIFAKFGLRSPARLLKDSLTYRNWAIGHKEHGDPWNEIRFNGTTVKSRGKDKGLVYKVEVVGIYIYKSEKVDFPEAQDVENLKKLAAELKLPLIRLPDRKDWNDDYLDGPGYRI